MKVYVTVDYERDYRVIKGVFPTYDKAYDSNVDCIYEHELQLELENNETLKVLAALVLSFLDGSHYETLNPYTRPEVKAALELIARMQGKSDYLEADVRALLE